MQLTGAMSLPVKIEFDDGTSIGLPSYEQIWNWQKNIDAGVGVVKEKMNRAINEQYNAHPVVDSQKAEFLRWATYGFYKGQTFWRWLQDPTDNYKFKWISRRDKWINWYAWEALDIEEGLSKNQPPAGW